MSAASITRVPSRALLACGIASSVLYLAMNAFVPLAFPGYSYADQTVSELSAIGAPSRSLWVPLGFLYDVLVAAFAYGVWIVGVWGRWPSARRRHLRTVAWLLLAYAVIGAAWPPMHLRETLAAGGGTISDTLHIVWTAIEAPLMMLAIAFGATVFGREFRDYSIATIVAMVTFGALTGTHAGNVDLNLPTPWIGVWERLGIGAFMLWMIAFATCLIRIEGRRSSSIRRGSASASASALASR